MTRVIRERVAVVTDFTDEVSLTEQSHKEQCDINYVLRDYAKTGVLKHVHENKGKYDDVSAMDFQEAANLVADVNSLFESLPSLTRQQFGNNPKDFLQFVQNPDTQTEVRDMGLFEGLDGFDKQGNPKGEIKALVDAAVSERLRNDPEKHGQQEPKGVEK